jgi:plasmid replication initiation protein
MESTLRPVNREPLVLLLSKNEFTAIERKIYWIILNQLYQGINVSPDLFKNMEFVIPIAALQETNRGRIKAAAERIMSRKLSYENPTNDSFELIVPFPYVKYQGNEGTLKIKMLAEVLPYFMELRNGYSEFELYAALSLTSEYSQRLYPLLSRWKDTGKWVNVEIESLKELLGASHYDRFVHFKQRVLDQAEKEINEKTDIEISTEFKKTGRHVTHVTFKILSKIKKEEKQALLAVKEELNTVANLNIGQILAQVSSIMRGYNFSSSQQKKIMIEPKLLQLFVEEDSKIVHGVRKNVLNKTAYMAKILGFSKK